MKSLSTNKLLIATMLALASPLSMAGHIDPLGASLSVYSNNGTGNFQLKYEQYFSADGWVWNAGANAWNPSYTIPAPTITSGSVNGPSGPINIFPTNPTDPAAPFAGHIPYTYDPANPPIVNISITDCCVHGTGASVTATVTVNTATVVTPVPEPASLALLGLGLMGMGWTRTRRA